MEIPNATPMINSEESMDDGSADIRWLLSMAQTQTVWKHKKKAAETVLKPTFGKSDTFHDVRNKRTLRANNKINKWLIILEIESKWNVAYVATLCGQHDSISCILCGNKYCCIWIGMMLSIPLGYLIIRVVGRFLQWSSVRVFTSKEVSLCISRRLSRYNSVVEERLVQPSWNELFHVQRKSFSRTRSVRSAQCCYLVSSQAFCDPIGHVFAGKEYGSLLPANKRRQQVSRKEIRRCHGLFQ